MSDVPKAALPSKPPEEWDEVEKSLQAKLQSGEKIEHGTPEAIRLEARYHAVAMVRELVGVWSGSLHVRDTQYPTGAVDE